MQKKWFSPLLAAELFFVLALYSVFYHGLSATHGIFVYPLDDTYIHAAIAKNIVGHGVWGVTPYAFTSASSSPVWVLLLSVCYFFTGVFDAAPLLLNIIVGLFLVAFVYHVFLANSGNSIKALLYTVLLISIIPLPSLVLSGMEHTLHLLISIVFLIHAVRIYDTPVDRASLRGIFLFSLAFLLPVIRYESIFLLLTVSTLFLVRKRYVLAVGIFGSALASIILYGLFSINHGWEFFPASVIEKAGLSFYGQTSVFDYLLGVLKHKFIDSTKSTVFLVASTGVFFIARATWKTAPRKVIFAVIVLVTTFFHLLFAKLGWFYRYEAYVILFNGIFLLLMLDEHLSRIRKSGKFVNSSGAVAAGILIITCYTFYFRGVKAYHETPKAIKNIYEQQYQTARLVKYFFPNGNIVLNDIGAVCYYEDIHLTDLWGLGDLEMSKLRLSGEWTRERIDKLVTQRDASIAIIYNVMPEYPKTWQKVAEFEINGLVTCAQHSVAIYNIDPQDLPETKAKVSAFSRHLPADIKQIIY